MTAFAPTEDTNVPPLAQFSGAHVPVRLGRFDAHLIAVSASEARLRHCGALKVGAEVPITFHLDRNRVVATGQVRSCSVVAIGQAASGGTIFETHLSFHEISADVRELLERGVEAGLA